MNDEPVKVLYFVDRMLRGGIQSLVIDWVSRFDKKKIHVDFLLLDDGNKYELEDTLKELGCNVYKLKGIWIRNPFDYIKYAKAMNNFFKNHHDYKVVHMHSTSKNYMVLKYAKKYGIPIRVAHSHALGFQTTSHLKVMIGNFLKKSLLLYATDYFACSNLAGQWLFGNDIIYSKNFKVIHNGVDLKKYAFNLTVRNKIRKMYKIGSNEVVIGHVGRFAAQKNHEFLIDIFNEYHKINSNSRLLLVGTGILEESIKKKAQDLKIEDKVIFAGFRNDVNNYMQAMDLFVLPSIFEGLGLVLIEAQASGLPCFTSKDVVPKEAHVSNLLTFINLNNNAREWANIINNSKLIRTNVSEKIKLNGYDISETTLELQNFYLK